jgi:hypothetical protein
LARLRNGRHSTNGRQSLKTLSTLIGQSVLVGLSRRDGFGVPSETRSSCPRARHHRQQPVGKATVREKSGAAPLGINPICWHTACARIRRDCAR